MAQVRAVLAFVIGVFKNGAFPSFVWAHPIYICFAVLSENKTHFASLAHDSRSTIST